MADHGLDLDALQAHGHSIFGPSSSAMWLNCAGSLIPHIQAPDNAGEDAAYGTVGHSVGEEWLNRIKDRREACLQEHDPDPLDEDDEFKQDFIDSCAPTDWIGRVITIKNRSSEFPIEITEEMLYYVREYVEWCFDLPGEHFIETKVDISDLTPIPSYGTADEAACEPGVLTITDLKMGRIVVLAKHNTQGLLYAYGFFRAYDHIYDFQRIIIRIAQPRMEHFDVWEITRDELLEFATWAKERAHAAWQKNAPRTPGEKQCRWCHVSDTCGAHLKWMLDMTDDVFEDLTVGEDGVIEGVTYSIAEIKEAGEQFEAGEREIMFRDPAGMTTAQMAKLLPMRKAIEKLFEGIAAELLARADDGEHVPGFKLVDGREGNREWIEGAKAELQFLGIDDPRSDKLKSPAEIEEVLHRDFKLKKSDAKRAISHLTFRRPGRKTLAPVRDLRDEIQSLADSSFEDVSDEL